MKERRIFVRDMRERREYVRFQIDQMVEMSFGQERFLRVEGVDLSEQGIRCISPDSIDPYSKVYVSFRIPIRHEEFQVQCEGIVVRVDKVGDEYSVAVQLTELDDAERKAIEACAKASITEKEQKDIADAKAEAEEEKK